MERILMAVCSRHAGELVPAHNTPNRKKFLLKILAVPDGSSESSVSSSTDWEGASRICH
jgi:hypothetical protein